MAQAQTVDQRSSPARKRGMMLLAAATLLMWVVGDTARAVETPPELNFVCVDKRDRIYQVTDPSRCAKGEASFRLPQDRPFAMCAEPQFGRLRWVSNPSSCTSKETAFTVPDSGPVYVCSRNRRDGTVQDRGEARRVSDPGQCDPRDETAYVTPAAPVGVADVFTASEDLLLTVPARGPLENDKDLTGQPLTARLVSGPAEGTFSGLAADGAFSYDPRGRFDHLDQGQKALQSFTYIANDGALDSEPTTATLEIVGRNDRPVSAADAYAANEDTPLVVPVTTGVLANDTDAEGHALSAILVSGPAKGALTLNPNGSLVFDPAGAFEALGTNDRATVTFTYVARDGSSDSDATQVTVTIGGVNDAPVARTEAYTVDENTLLTVAAPGLLSNDTDAESGPLTARLASAPSRGVLALQADGSFRFDPRSAFDGLESGQTATETFAYEAHDGEAASAPTTVTISVTGISPPGAVDDAYSTDEDREIELDLLANDTPRGGTLTVPFIDANAGCAAPSGALAGPDQDGLLRYDPRAAFNHLPAGTAGADTFCYELRNDEGRGVGKVSLGVAGRNDAPEARPNTFMVTEDTRLTEPAPGVLGNDLDPDDGETPSLSAVLVSAPDRGRLTLRSDGGFDFEPAGELRAGETVSTTFGYRARDIRGTESPTTIVTLTIEGVNATPVIENQVFSVNEKSPKDTLVGTVAFSDTDPGDTHQLAITGGNDAGYFRLDGTSIVIASEVGPDASTPSFALTVRVTDAEGASASATIRVNIVDVNDLPIPGTDEFTTVGNTQLVSGGATPTAGASVSSSANVLHNDSDPDGDTLSVVPASGATTKGGTYSIAANGSFRYDPPAGVRASADDPDTFQYAVTDGGSTDDAVTATVEVVIDRMVWYVNNAASGSQDGTSIRPFSALASVNGGLDPDAAGDTIFVFKGTGDPYPGGIALEDDQHLTGQGIDLVVLGHRLVAKATPGPTIAGTGTTPGVKLASGNTVRGLSIATNGAAGLSGTTFGTAKLEIARIDTTGAPAVHLETGTVEPLIVGTLPQPAIAFASSTASSTTGISLKDVKGTLNLVTGAISGAQGNGVDVNGGTATTTIGTAISNVTGRAVRVQSLTGGSVAFTAPVSGGGQGVHLSGNAAGSLVRFTGGLTLSTGASTAFLAESGGTVEVTGTANTVETTTGSGLTVTDVTVGAGGLRFRSVSTNGAPQGIVLSNTGATGPISVTGTGGLDSGGLIRASNVAVSVTDAAKVSMAGIRVTQGTQYGFDLTRAKDVTLNKVVVEDAAANGIRAHDVTNLTVNGGSVVQRSAGTGVLLTNAKGTSTLLESVVRSSFGGPQVLVRNTAATAAAPGTPDVVRLESMRFEENKGDVVQVEAGTGSNLQLLVGSPAGLPNFVTGGKVGVRGRAYDGGRLDVDITRLFHQLGESDAIVLSAAGAATDGTQALLTFDVYDNNADRGGRIFQPAGSAVRLSSGPGGVVEGNVVNNDIIQPQRTGVVVASAGGTIRPTIGSNRIEKPGCIGFGDVGDDRCLPEDDDPDQDPPPACPAYGDPGPTSHGVLVTSDAGGTVDGAIRTNQITDPFGGGVIVSVVGGESDATLVVGGNRIEQTVDCSFPESRPLYLPDENLPEPPPVELLSTPIRGTASAGTLSLTGGRNTVLLTTSEIDEVVVTSADAGTATVDLEGDVLRNGRRGVFGQALGGSTLTLDLAKLTRSAGTDDAIDLLSRGTGSSLDADVTDGNATHMAGITDPGGHGIEVTADPGTTVTGSILDNEIARTGGAGIVIHGIEATGTAITLKNNEVEQAGGSGIIVHADGGSLTGTAVQSNTVTDPNQDGIALGTVAGTVTGTLDANTVTQTLAGSLAGTPILVGADAGVVNVGGPGGNDVTLLSGSTTTDAIVVDAANGSTATYATNGDAVTNGATALKGSAVEGSTLLVNASNFASSSAAADGMHLQAVGATSAITAFVRGGDMDIDAAIDGSGDDGIEIVALSGATATAAVSSNRITGAGGTGIRITGSELTVDEVVDNRITGAGGTGIFVAGMAAQVSGVVDNRVVGSTGSGIVAQVERVADAIGNSVTTPGGDGIVLEATTVGTASDNDVRHPGGDGIRITAVHDGPATVSASGNVIHGDLGGYGLDLVLEGNPLTASITGNVVDAATSSADAIRVDTTGPGTATVDENTVGGAIGGRGIAVSPDGGSFDLLVRANSVEPSTAGGDGIEITGPSADPLCLDLSGNHSTPPEPFHGFSLIQSGGDFGLQDLTSADTIPEWASRKGNTGSVQTTGTFSGCSS